MSRETLTSSSASRQSAWLQTIAEAPFLRAPEGARTVFLVTLAAAAGPLVAGMVFFGWRAAMVTAISVLSCVTIEWLYYRVTRLPSLWGRSHAVLTGVLVAMTLPAFVPWYVPVIAAAFAILVGKAIFGGVGHLLWTPALVGRLAVAVLMPTMLTQPFAAHRNAWPLLAQNKILTGDVLEARVAEDYRQWRDTPAPENADAFLLPHPSAVMSGLTFATQPAYSRLAYPRKDIHQAKPLALQQMPPMADMLYGARPGGIGETCIIMIVVAGLYLVYRNYIKWQLPIAMLLGAWIVAAIAPIYFAGPNNTIETVWWPLLGTHLGNLSADLRVQVGFTYVNYQLLSCELMLAAFFLAPEMTSRPVTTGGQVLFGLAAGVIGMLAKLYLDTPIPFYLAVLAMNTLTPTIDAMWQPRVLGVRHFALLRR